MLPLLFICLACVLYSTNAFVASGMKFGLRVSNVVTPTNAPRIVSQRNQLQMNFFDDAFRFFSNMKKEASAKHILLKGDDAATKLALVKEELQKSDDISLAFSEMAAKISECPSASRGGNLGTFKPGMMVKEFDEVVFGEEVGKVHGPVKTQFGAHLILITRRYEGEEK